MRNNRPWTELGLSLFASGVAESYISPSRLASLSVYAAHVMKWPAELKPFTDAPPVEVISPSNHALASSISWEDLGLTGYSLRDRSFFAL